MFDRLNRVLKSQMNALLESAEDPDKLIGQTILDLESELRHARAEHITVLGTVKRLEKKQADHLEQATRWEEKAVLALRAGDETLAREALRFKLKEQAEAARSGEHAAREAALTERMEQTLEAVAQRIGDLKARRGSLAAEVRQARQACMVPGTLASRTGAFGELDRVAGRIDELEAEVEAANVLRDPREAEVEARFRELEKEAAGGAVEDQLAALKERLRG